jgi:hypothetical protein
MIGFDAGFFAGLLKKNQAALETWRKIVDDEEQSIIRPMTLFSN